MINNFVSVMVEKPVWQQSDTGIKLLSESRIFDLESIVVWVRGHRFSLEFHGFQYCCFIFHF